MTTQNNNGPGVQPQTQALTKVDRLKSVISADSVQAQFKNALAENKDAFVASLIDLYSGDQYLQNCDPVLVIQQALKAAVLKLAINKSLGHAYIIPYKSNGVDIPQFQIGYKGLIQLALRTGWYETINADEVLEGQMVTKNKLTGEFDLREQATSNRVVGYFAYIRSKTGFSKTFYMTVEKIQEHGKKYSKAYGNQYGPWQKEFPAMAKKTVISHLLSHYGLVSIEMQAGFDNDADDQIQEEIKANGNQGPAMSFDNVPEAQVVQPTGGQQPGETGASMGFANEEQNNNNEPTDRRPF